MLRSTETATEFDGSAQAKRWANVICSAFDATPTQLAVVTSATELLANSQRIHPAIRHLFRTGTLDAAQCPTLFDALTSCFVAGVSQVVEVEAPTVVDGPLRIECAPWDVPLSAAPGQGRSSGIAQRVALLVVRDDAELNAIRRRVEQVNRVESLGMLAGSVAHDFNNLLTGIRGSLALVRHHVSVEGRETALCAAEAAAQRAGEMTRRLLSFTRGPERISARAEPSSVLHETVQLLRCMPDSTRVDTDIEDGLGAVDMLPSELHQVVLNLLMNASDAVRSLGAASGVMLRADTTWRARPGGARATSRWLRVSVIDRGPGMDANVRKRIFEPFFTTKPRGTGTGLGLSSVKDMVDGAGGWLEVESEPERGSSFHVYLPLSGSPPEADVVPVTEVVRSQPMVLICDDEGRLGELTVGLLEEFGFAARAVLRGEDAVAVFSSTERPDALLLDVNLSSGMSALSLLQQLDERGVTVPVILTSGLSVEDLPGALRRHPRVVSYLGKPYTVGELVKAISDAVPGGGAAVVRQPPAAS